MYLMEGDQEKQAKKKNTIRISVYLPENLLKEMDKYKRDHGYATRSALIRHAYKTHRLIYDKSSSPGDLSLTDRLENIEKTIEEFQLELKLALNRKQDIEHEIEATELNINFEEVASELLAAIKDPQLFDGSVKDYVIIDYFKGEYSRGIIFHVLSTLKNQGILSLKDGVWEIIDK